jgi:DivIVA domain-containing protein
VADFTPKPGLTGGAPAGRRTFSTAFRGFDQEEVKAYLEDLAREFHELRERIAELESELDAARATPPGVAPPAPPVAAPKVDVVAITNALGEETARVLRTAQEAADDLRARAEEGAAAALREAHEDAARIRAEADALLVRRNAEAEETATRLRTEAEEAAATMRSEAREEADRTIAEAIEQGRDMLSQAQAARERVLADLARRRKVGLAQIERLRAGREQLSATLASARGDIDRMVAALAEADEEARRVEEAMGPVTRGGGDDVTDAAAAPPPTEATGEQDAGAVPATVTEEVGAAVAGAAAPATTDAGTPAAPSGAGDNTEETAPTATDSTAQAEDGAGAVEAPAPEPPGAPDASATPAADAATARSGEDGGEAAVEAAAGSPPTRAPYKHDRVPAAVLPGDAVGAGEPGERRTVDALFARIRADRAGPEPEEAHEEEHEEVAAAAAREDHALEVPRSDEDEAFLQRRDALLEAPLASTARAVKRGLADEQNLALERLRTARTVTLDAVLDDEAAHRARASRWAAPGLAAVARVGASLAGKPDLAVPDDVVAPAVARVAEELVGPVRERMAKVIEEGGPDMADRLNSTYREARGRIDRVVGDAATETVSRAFVAANAAGTPVRWVVDDPDGPCPDCDDNALAGPTPLGQVFPTGQVSPPAHPGCRCLLVPAPT